VPTPRRRVAHEPDLADEPAEDDDDGDECASPVIDDDCPASDQETAPEPHRSLQITPPPLDPAKARPRAVIYVHLSEEALNASRGVARVEEVGPVLLSQLRMILGDHCSISVKPVIDLPAGHTAVDAYEIPASLREQILLRNPADAFPYAAAVCRSIDIDHTIPYLNPDKGGPPGQTRIGNLGPHTRYHHRIKTHSSWQVSQPQPGTWLWRWVNHPPHSCRLLRVRPSQRDDEIGSWQALRNKHRIVLVSRTGPIVSLVGAHSVLLVAVGQPLQTRRVIHL
jgi:hypothetical protein